MLLSGIFRFIQVQFRTRKLLVMKKKLDVHTFRDNTAPVALFSVHLKFKV